MMHKKRILVVEDDRSIARGLKELLQSEGYTVHVAYTGEQALARSLAPPADLTLLDVTLPHVNGLEVCRRIRAQGNWNPILMLTARRDQADKVIGLDAGADDYLTKPFDAR